MKSLFRVAAQLDDLLVERGWRYCFIEGNTVRVPAGTIIADVFG